jgi:hypothetical protein
MMTDAISEKMARRDIIDILSQVIQQIGYYMR